MSTTSATPAPTGFWATLKGLLPAIELAGNVAISLLVPGGAALATLIGSLEGAVNPLLQSIGTQTTVPAQVMTVYATIIGVLTALKSTPGLPAETLATINAYVLAAEQGTAAYLQAENGFDPTAYTPVTPIA
jgi:hypothetical protein